MWFERFPDDDFVGFYAALNEEGNLIKTLGTLTDTCATSTAATNILEKLGATNPFGDFDPFA